jgi:hypothetical protein
MPPCSIAISQAKWHSLWRMHRIRHLPFALALKSAKSLHLPALPSANANVFAIRFSEWQSLWRMLAFAKLKLPLGKIKFKRCCV